MAEKNQQQPPEHLDMPSGASRDKLIDSPGGEQDGATRFVVHNHNIEGQQDPEHGIEEGNEETGKSKNPPSSDSPMRVDGDETIGVP